MAIPRLIVGGTRQQRRRQAGGGAGPDWRLIDPEGAVTIAAVRSLEKFLLRKALALPQKTALIVRAENLTLPAQQALLKTLEEPPVNSQIILLAPAENRLLPTVVSRCRVEFLAPAKMRPGNCRRQEEIYRQLSAASPSARFDLIAAYSHKREEAVKFVINQRRYCRNLLLTGSRSPKPDLFRALNTAETALRANVNPKLTLEVLSLSY